MPVTKATLPSDPDSVRAILVKINKNPQKKKASVIPVNAGEGSFEITAYRTRIIADVHRINPVWRRYPA